MIAAPGIAITAHDAPTSAADGPQPGYNPYVTVDYIEAAPGGARQETSLGSLHALGSVRQLGLFANSRGSGQGSGAWVQGGWAMAPFVHRVAVRHHSLRLPCSLSRPPPATPR